MAELGQHVGAEIARLPAPIEIPPFTAMPCQATRAKSMRRNPQALAAGER